MAKAKKSACLKPKDCRLAVARLDFNAARGCSAKEAAAEEFRKVAAKAASITTKAKKAALFKEALRKVAAAHRACGREAAAAQALRWEESESARFNGLSAVRKRRKRRKR